MYQQVDILAIGAHPDDVELGAGGALLKAKAAGQRFAIVDLTRGELGSRGDSETRKKEAAEAARVLGAVFRGNLGLPDGSVSASPENRLPLIEAIRGCRPSTVVTHSASGHPDHWATSQLVREACHHAGLTRIDTGQERFRPSKIAYWLQSDQRDLPQLLVDVTSVYTVKEAAIRAYRSQLYDARADFPETYLSRSDFLDQVKAHHRFLGNLGGCSYAEGFLLSRPPLVDDLLCS